MRPNLFIPLITLLFFTGRLSAQLDYTKLEQFSKKIESLQSSATDLTYVEADRQYKLSFPPQGFKMLFSNKRATQATFFSPIEKGKEILRLISEVNLANATDIFVSEGNGSARIISITISNAFKRKTIEDGVEKENDDIYTLHLFASDSKAEELFNVVLDLVYTLKLEAGNRPSVFKEAMDDWKKTAEINTTEAYSEFEYRHPTYNPFKKETNRRVKLLVDEKTRKENKSTAEMVKLRSFTFLNVPLGKKLSALNAQERLIYTGFADPHITRLNWQVYGRKNELKKSVTNEIFYTEFDTDRVFVGFNAYLYRGTLEGLKSATDSFIEKFTAAIGFAPVQYTNFDETYYKTTNYIWEKEEISVELHLRMIDGRSPVAMSKKGSYDIILLVKHKKYGK